MKVLFFRGNNYLYQLHNATVTAYKVKGSGW